MRTDTLKTKSNLSTSLNLIQGLQNKFKADLKFIKRANQRINNKNIEEKRSPEKSV